MLSEKQTQPPITISLDNKKFLKMIKNLKGKNYHVNKVNELFIKNQIEKFLNQNSPGEIFNNLIKKYKCTFSNKLIADNVGENCSKTTIRNIRNATAVNYRIGGNKIEIDKIYQIYRVITEDPVTELPADDEKEISEFVYSLHPYLRLEIIYKKFLLNCDSCHDLKMFCVEMLNDHGIDTKYK